MSAAPSSSSARILACVLTLAGVLGHMGCKTKVNNRSGGRAGNTAWIVANSVTFTRSPDRTEGTLQFQTTIPLLCAIEYWARDSKMTPNESSPASVNCSSNNPTTQFQEVMRPLQAETTYSFRLLLWRSGESRAQAQPYRIDEGGDDGNVVSSDIVVARVDFPQKVASFHTHTLSGKTTIDELRKPLMQSLGCNGAIPSDPYSYSSAAAQNKLEAISADGFSKFQAKPHPGYPNILIQSYSAINLATEWEWSYRWAGQSDQFRIEPPGYLSKISFISGTDTRLQVMKLTDQVPSIALSPQGPVQVEWVAKNLAPASYLSVNLKGQKTGHSIHCSFAANVGKGEIPENFVSAMPADTYELTTILESHQIHLSSSPATPTWVISSNDWRYALVTKQ